MTRTPWLAVAALFLAGPAFAADPPLVTKTYDLKAFVGGQGAAPTTDADAVVRVLLDAVRMGDLKPGGDGPRVTLLDGDRLELRATAKVHGEAKDLFEALARLADLAIDLKAELVEFDAAAFDKDVKPLFKPAAGKVDLPTAVAFGTNDEAEPGAAKKPEVPELNKALKAGRVVQSGERRYANGREAEVSAQWAVYTNPKPKGFNLAGEQPATWKEGFRLLAVPVVSADRRYVRLKLTEQSSERIGERKHVLGEVGGTPIVFEARVVEDAGRAATVVVGDGEAALFRLGYAPKGKVWVVALWPTIFIRAEEELNKEEKPAAK